MGVVTTVVLHTDFVTHYYYMPSSASGQDEPNLTPANTKIKTQSDMKAWKRFCLQENESRELCDIPQEELNLLSCKFFKTVKKLDATEYEPVSLTSFQWSLQRSLNERGSNVNIIDGDNFKLSREVLSAKRRQLVVDHGKRNRPQAAHELTEAEEDKLFECSDVWYMRSPLGKNEIGKFLPTTAKNAGLQGRVTNHSVRKTCISRLLDADFPDNRSPKSLDAYKSASHKRQQ